MSRGRGSAERRIGDRHRVLGLMLLTAAIGLAGCDREAVPDETATEDRAALDREMDLALGAEGEPELRDPPAEDAADPPPAPPPPPPAPKPGPPPQAAQPDPPVTDAPAETAEPEGPRTITVTAPADATFSVEMRQEVSTRTNRPGDPVTATIREPLLGGRFVVLPAGALVRGEVTAIQRSEGQGKPAIIKLNFYEVFHEGQAFPLHATIVGADPRTEGSYSTGDKAARVGGGAGAGAILGAILGGGKGAVIGAAVGAAAGTAITLITEDVDAVLPVGSVLDMVLDEPLEIITIDPYSP